MKQTEISQKSDSKRNQCHKTEFILEILTFFFFWMWVLTNLNLFRMAYFWNFCNEDWKSCDWEILRRKNTLVALYLHPQKFMSIDQLKIGSRQIWAENKRSSEIWKCKLKMMGTCYIYHTSYLTTQKKYSKWIWCVQLLSKELKQNWSQYQMTCLHMLP